MSKPRVKVPRSAAVGEEIEIKTLISHTMESGRRKDGDGNVIPRKIINFFSATFNGEEVMTMNLEPAISTNPFIQFGVKMAESGEFTFLWVDDDGTEYTTSKSIEVS